MRRYDSSRMTVMEMRWAKKVSNSDCLISSDVYGYLYFDLVRYMKCTFSLSLAFGRFLYGLFLYIKWLYFESQFFQVKYVRETIQKLFVLSMDSRSVWWRCLRIFPFIYSMFIPTWHHYSYKYRPATYRGLSTLSMLSKDKPTATMAAAARNGPLAPHKMLKIPLRRVRQMG